MFLSNISIKRPIMMSMFLSVFLIFGLLSYLGMSLDLFPSVEFPFITVQTIYPGGGPEELETQVTKKIEDAISTISKIKEVKSFSMEGVSFVMIQFELDKDVDIANQEVKDKVDAILNELPEDAEIPLVQKFDMNAEPIIDLIFSGNLKPTELHKIAEKKLKDRFSQIEGVANVSLSGGQEREISIELDNKAIFQNKISLLQLSQILKAYNINLPGGNFQLASQEYVTRVDGEFKTLETLRQLQIPTAFGTKKLEEIAKIKDTGAEVRERTTFYNNKTQKSNPDVILMRIVKSVDGNTVKIAEAVREEIPVIESELPAGCNIEITTDKSIFIQSSVDDTMSNIIMGIILTGLVLLFFLHDVRSTIIVALAMPMSILSAFLLMDASGFTVNIMTLMGLSTAVGILVTNSVVVLENIFRHKEMGNPRKEAAAKGTSEIVLAVVASTLTNIAVFLPIANMSSMVGQFFKQFALTVTFATIFSLLISFTLTPMMASLIIPEHDEKKHPLGKKLEKWFKSWENSYQSLLQKTLKNKLRAFMVIVAPALLFIVSLPAGAKIGFEFMPMMDEGDIKIQVELPSGYNLEGSGELIQKIESRLKNYQEVKHIITNMGALNELDKGTNLALMMVKLVNANERNLKTAEMADLFIQELSDIPNAKLRISAVSSGAGGGEDPISFTLKGQDFEVLKNLKTTVIEKIENIDGLINLSTSVTPGKPEIIMDPDLEKLSRAGLTVYDLALSIRSSVNGMVSTQYKESGEEYDIRVKLQKESINTPEKIRSIYVASPTGKVYQVSQLSKIHFKTGVSKILHLDKYKAIQITGAPAAGVPLGNVVGEIRNQLETVDFPRGYKADWGTMTEMMDEAISDMGRTFLLALILTYMLLAAILESLTQPLLILGTVPLAFIGVFWGLFLTGINMNIISMMAIVMLLGIVVNNAILLLDYTNLLVKQGKTVFQALTEACPTKLKPIIMSTIAIMLGMLPMAMGWGESGSEVRQPMGIVSIGGLIVSAVMSLLVIPALYRLTHTTAKKTKK